MEQRHFGAVLKKVAIVLCVLLIIAAGAVIALFAWANSHPGVIMDSIDSAAGSGQGASDRRENVFTLLVAATDEDEVRTDSIMVATFDLSNKTVDVLNIPRDTLVDTERDDLAKKINAAYGSGVEQLKAEVSQVVGYEPDKYMIVNFDGIAKIMDSIGGIDYNVPFDMSYHDKAQGLSIEFKQGYQHLDGEEIVEFLRWRHNDDDAGYEDGDVGRVTKLQDFIKALSKKILVPTNLIRLPQMAHTMSQNIDTDLTTGQLFWLALQGVQYDKDNMNMETLAGDSAQVDFDLGYYVWFYIVDEEMALEQINQSFNPYKTDLTQLDIVTPDTLGRYSPDWIEAKKYRYELLGFDFVYEGPPDPPAADDGTEVTDDGGEDGYSDGGYDESGYDGGYAEDDYSGVSDTDDGYDSYDDGGYDDGSYEEDWGY